MEIFSLGKSKMTVIRILSFAVYVRKPDCERSDYSL